MPKTKIGSLLKGKHSTSKTPISDKLSGHKDKVKRFLKEKSDKVSAKLRQTKDQEDSSDYKNGQEKKVGRRKKQLIKLKRPHRSNIAPKLQDESETEDTEAETENDEEEIKAPKKKKKHFHLPKISRTSKGKKKDLTENETESESDAEVVTLVKRTKKSKPPTPFQIKVLILFLLMLLGLSLLVLIFVPVGDRLSRRYGWNIYEPHVLTLLVFMGLSSCGGIFAGIYLYYFKLDVIQKSNVVPTQVLITVGISLSLTVISFIYSLGQYFASRSLFGSKFLKLVVDYKYNHGEKMLMDRIQIEFKCCGLNSKEDWELVATPEILGEGFVPFSCCNLTVLRPCVHENVQNSGSDLSIYGGGCQSAMQDYYEFLLAHVIWTFGLCCLVEVGILSLLFYINKRK